MSVINYLYYDFVFDCSDLGCDVILVVIDFVGNRFDLGCVRMWCFAYSLYCFRGSLRFWVVGFWWCCLHGGLVLCMGGVVLTEGCLCGVVFCLFRFVGVCL